MNPFTYARARSAEDAFHLAVPQDSKYLGGVQIWSI
jgi:CO/xanthine dehydrogenase FAD-binding subunit